MPQPGTKDLIVAGPLQNASVAYRNKNYIADRVFPVVDGVDVKAKVARYLKGAWFRDEAGIRGPGSRAPRGGYPVDYITIAPKEYAFAKEVTDEDRRYLKSANAPPLRPDQDAIEICSDKLDLKKEVRTAALIKSGTWSGVVGEDAAGLWAPNDATNTFFVDVETRIETIRSNTGVRPNVLVLSANTLASLKQVDAILNRIRYVERGILTAPLIAAMFELDECLIGEAVTSSAKEKADGSDFAAVNIWETNATKGGAFLFYRPPSVGLKTPSAGMQCRCAYEDGSPRRVTVWREAAEHQDVYEVAEETDIVITGADLGFYWYDTILT
jgi:hypothetical protein